jgi:pyridoxine/pyridoxamine 5'-phosphate oxidase
MKEPMTELDPRFSDPGTVATDWDETRRALEAAELFWICTVRADGRPHVSPLVAVWLDGAIHFTTGADEQKAVNLAGNPHVILATGCNRWDGGLDVVVEGDAVRVTDDELLGRLAGRGRRSGTDARSAPLAGLPCPSLPPASPPLGACRGRGRPRTAASWRC